MLAGGAGLWLFHSRKLGAVVLVALAVAIGVLRYAPMPLLSSGLPRAAGLAELGAIIFTIGAFTFGGGLTMIAFIQDQMVHQLHWLTPHSSSTGSRWVSSRRARF